MADRDGRKVIPVRTLEPKQPAVARHAASVAKGHVLLLEADMGRQARLQRALSAWGFSVLAVSRIAEIERWPIGQVVITDQQRFTPWWKEVGAAHVIVLADTADAGEAAVLRGASAWLPRECSPDVLLTLLERMVRSGASSALPRE